jgi:hypothetical protein
VTGIGSLIALDGRESAVRESMLASDIRIGNLLRVAEGKLRLA